MRMSATNGEKTENMTIKEYLKKASAQLKNAGIDAPAFEAGVIVCHAKKISKAYLYAHSELELTQAEITKLDMLLEQREAHKPLQYILGWTEFMSLSFEVGPNVLIPRQETELLVEKCLELARENFKVPEINILDLCTGSGCIGISIAKFLERSRVMACDISLDALEIARRNAKNIGVDNRMDFKYGDLFDSLGKSKKFDLIASNPPYIETDTIEGLQAEVRDYEPRIALDGGSDGLSIYRRIVKEAPDYLSSGGYLIMEIGYNQGYSVSTLLSERYRNIETVKDIEGNDRVVIAQKF